MITGGGWQNTSTNILRLNNDGSRDAGFKTGTGADGYLWKVAIQNDGKILVGGNFKFFNGNNKNFLARLNADGSLDNSFNSGTGPDSSVSAIAIQNDGKIVIGGDFTSYNGIARNKIARLNTDGTLDSSFKPGTGANGSINAIAIQTDGKILIGGNFTAYNGTGRNRIARLMGIGSTAAYISIAITSGTNPTCIGQSITFTASPTNGGISPIYQWKVNGNNVGTNSPTYTTNTLTSGQVISCVMTSNFANADPSTATSNSITIAFPPTPVAGLALTSGTNPSCAGQSLTFTATPANGGINPSYQWKVNGNNVGTNSPTYITNTLTNGQVVSCVMTSSVLCTSPVTSNPITIAINSCPPSAQPPDWAWAKKSVGIKDDYSWRITKDNNDNVYVAGRFSRDSLQFGSITLHAPGGGMFVVKYDASGNVIWGRSDAGNANSDALCIAADQNGNVYVAGEFQSTSIKFGNITLSRTDNGYSDTYLVKFDSAGNVIWAKSGIGDRWSDPWGLAVDNSGNIYMTGEFWSTSMNFSGTILNNANPWNYVDVFLVKYNSAGNVLWAKRAESYSFATYVNGIAVDNTGNIYVTGSFKGDYNYGDSLKFGNFTLYNHSGGDAPNYFIVKYDPAGNVLWANGADKFLGRSSGDGIATDKWGNVYVVGDFEYNNIKLGNSVVAYRGSKDIFITKYDPSGNVKWAKGLSSAGYEYSDAIITDNDGNIYVGGFFANDNINIGGIVYNNAGPAGTSDILVVKSDSTGNFLWTKTAGGNDGEGVAGIVTDANKNVYISGSFYSSFVTLGCTTLFNSDSTGKSSDFYIAKLGGSDANVMPALSIALTSGANSICQGQSVTFTATPTNGGPSPTYQWKINGNNVGTNSPTFTTSNLTNGQVVTCTIISAARSCATAATAISNSIAMSVNSPATCSGSGVVSPANLDFQVHPNPANQKAIITFYLGASVRISLDVFNVAGQQIGIIEDRVLNSGNQTIPWNTEKVAAGMYFIRLKTVNYSTTKKVIVIH